MPRKDEADDYIISESGNWNVAARFAEEKIMKPLINCDIYEDLALFGYDSILEDLLNYEQVPKEIIKITGLKRLVKELIKLSRNTKFAMKIKGTKEELENIEKQLKKIDQIIPLLSDTTYSVISKTKNTNIDLDKFDYILTKVSELKSKINEPLNKNHLIFTDKEEFDPVAFKERIKNRMINKG